MSGAIDHFYEFGNFRVDPARRLLWRDGEVIALTPKVFDTLLVLVGSSGRVMEKDELMREVWADAAVEEVGLAKNVSTLRKALGESPDSHRFIVTVPGRGYRFVASVKSVPARNEESAGPGPGESASPPAPPPVGKRRSRPSRRVVALGALPLIAAGLLLYFRQLPALTDRDSILLTDFLNQTGDPVFDPTLKQGLAVQLEQSPLLNIFPDVRVRETLRLMGRTPDEAITRDTAREICQRQGLKALIAGSIAPFGSHYAITLEAAECHSGVTLAREQVEADSKEQVLKALSVGASRLREKLGESLGSIQAYGALLERTTSSLEALRAYSLGFQERRNGHTLGAIPLFRKAVELDPKFAYAYADLAALYRNARQTALAAEYAVKAYALRDRASEREKLRITALYYDYVTGEADKNIETLKLYQRIYPRDALPHNNLGVTYSSIGQYELALEESRAAMRLDPESASRYSTQGLDLFHLNRFAEAKDTYQRALRQKLDNTAVRHGLYRIAFLAGDRSAMEEQVRWAAGRQNEYTAFAWQAATAAYLGRWRRSTELLRSAIDAATRSDAREVGAVYASGAALSGAALGQCREAKSIVSEGLALERNSESLTRAAATLALCGESGEAQLLVDELIRRYPRHTVVTRIWLPVIRAALALREGHAGAIDMLKPAEPYEAAAEFWPQYLRGQAFLRGQRYREARMEFQKILDHRGQHPDSVLYALGHLGVARAAAPAGEKGAARASYRAFLELWKDADSGLPALAEAKQELASLR